MRPTWLRVTDAVLAGAAFLAGSAGAADLIGERPMGWLVLTVGVVKMVVWTYQEGLYRPPPDAPGQATPPKE